MEPAAPTASTVYGTSAFPTNTYQSDNYWVDVVFSPTGSYSISGHHQRRGRQRRHGDASGASQRNRHRRCLRQLQLQQSGERLLHRDAEQLRDSPSPPRARRDGEQRQCHRRQLQHASTYSISGTISGAGGSGATVNLSGTSTATITADASGNYTFTGLANGSYTVTPEQAGFTFTPASQAITVNNANVTGVNFSTVDLQHLRHDQRRRRQRRHRHLTGASTATVTADASGNYTFTAWRTAPTRYAEQVGLHLHPASQPATVTTPTSPASTSARAPTAFPGTISGAGGNGATVTLSGASTATVTANASGTYTFSNLVNGSYTVTPSKSGFTFTPASQPAP